MINLKIFGLKKYKIPHVSIFVRKLFIIFYLVLAIFGNKSDDYANEKVQDIDAKNLQKF